MKKIIFTGVLLLSSLLLFAQGKLVLMPLEQPEEVYALFENSDLTIHHYNDNFIIATLEKEAPIQKNTLLLDAEAFSGSGHYYIVYCPPTERSDYLSKVKNEGSVLYRNDDFLIMKQLGHDKPLTPAKNDGMVHISKSKASLPLRAFDFPVITEVDPVIQTLMETVNTDSIIATVQHLQDYGTRVYNQPQTVQAQNWIKAKYDTMGLETEIQPISYPSGSSGNVIAIQRGTVYPDEYIVCGSHYDSFTEWGSFTQAPGADDNATGTAGILEIARILSQYEFERSIIYCCFGAEELGLRGSDIYASRCRQQGMTILGYFNIDMSGYLKSGTDIHIDMIHPASAAPLANYYINIANIYLPNIPVTSYSSLPWGDSDHTSFNENGYYGIYPFEDINYCSPYVHTFDDLIGLSVNTPEQCKIYTQATFSCIVTLAQLVSEEVQIPIPDFTVSNTEIEAETETQFTDLSQNAPTQWHWYFEGGTPAESNEQNPSVLYETAGAFDVKLVVTNEAGSDSILKEKFITVTEKILPPIADFSANITKIDEGESVLFANLSQNNPDTYRWYFEGGEPLESSEENPLVIYNREGVFSVKLTVTNVSGSDTKVEEDYVTVLKKEGINQLENSLQVRVYPNPAHASISIESEEPVSIKLYSLTGALLYETTTKDAVTHISTESWSSGVYLLEITSESASVTKKVVVP